MLSGVLLAFPDSLIARGRCVGTFLALTDVSLCSFMVCLHPLVLTRHHHRVA